MNIVVAMFAKVELLTSLLNDALDTFDSEWTPRDDEIHPSDFSTKGFIFGR